ncbi:MAG: hypothetical protein K0R36_795 [Chryseobacterium sp.]|jgi:hypothetical protein|uniref:hypothetical protein n=1 Tax=Chryseobacterium sp. TaxID=1871047 RepID=UPI0026290998|nr:hypothetical protein [Chryseobacterium sp.]MDF2553546.1 hypothetical protein [Chryseobacterium sp.]MDF2931464.1 hypothetical protein [Chryseobacterium sp.]
MKRIILALIIGCSGSLSSQESKLTVSNYSTYDFHGILIATPLGSCYPMVSISGPAVPNELVVPAGTVYGLSSYPSATGITSFLVQTSATSPAIPRAPSHPSLSPPSGIATMTDWRHTKFQMYFAGTSVPVSSGGTSVPETYFNGNLGDGTNSCWLGDSYISTTYGDAEFFKISSGGITYSYINIY